MTPIVLVHGGSFAGSCWDLVLDRLSGPALAVDLPGRGVHPCAPDDVTIASAAACVVADIDAAGFDEVVLVGHSLAGCSMPATIGLLGGRTKHAVFVACTVPDDGSCAVDALPAELQEFARAALASGITGTLDAEMAKVMFGNDLDDAQFAWMMERMVPEVPGLLLEPVDLAPLRSSFPRTWIRPVHDASVDPERQLHYAQNAGGCDVLDMDAGHMCMISRPAALATILEDVAEQRT